MATTVRGLFLRWKMINKDTRYYITGIALSVPMSMSAGVKSLREFPHEVALATGAVVSVGVATVCLWPAVLPTYGVYKMFYLLDKKINSRR